jgi:2-polyprenyl-3-methyl-5-hydroxy-6-metoxy-1,4-benzoquinol methylase
MSIPTEYLNKNKESWNQRTDFHLKSEFYNQKEFMKGRTSLNEIELSLLGDISGKSILHLQCHIGQDSLSFARMGAQVTGVDLSDNAINNAQRLNAELGLDAKFICCNVYDLPQHLDGQFDIVYVSYGAIVWLPDLEKWAGIISRYLKPGGQFVFVEFHPVVMLFDNDFSKIAYRYFNSGAIIETETGTYAERGAEMSKESVTWNHSLSEVINSLIKSGLQIKRLDEHDYSPYNCFSQTEKIADRKYRIKHLGDKIPMVYALVAEKSK